MSESMERYGMKKTLIIVFILFLIAIPVNAQFGIGASGGFIYPGLSSSQNYGSKFNIGPGYDLFVRHSLLKISDEFKIDAFYGVSGYYSDIDMVRIGVTRFYFNYLSIGVRTKIKNYDSVKIMGGAGLSMVNAEATKANFYYGITETLLVPNINISAEYWFNKNFNIFATTLIQMGKLPAQLDDLRIDGVRLQFGGTMFLTD